MEPIQLLFFYYFISANLKYRSNFVLYSLVFMQLDVLHFILFRLCVYVINRDLFFLLLSDLIIVTKRHQSVNNSDAFCCICGYFMIIRQRRNITSFVRRT